MKKLSVLLWAILLLAHINVTKAENSPEGIVQAFGDALSSWCSTDEIVYREKINELCYKQCRVEDKILTAYLKGKGSPIHEYETYTLDTYMNMFQDLILQSLKYQMANIKVIASKETSDGTLTIITADIYVSGTINQKVTNLFLVRHGKITGIYSHSSSLGLSHLNNDFTNVAETQNTPESIVSSFGEALSSWCSTDEIVYREKIDELCSGSKICRVEDNIHAEYQKGRGLTNYETFVLESYMNMFASLIPQSLNYQMTNIKVVGSDEMPDGTLTFITADIKMSGALNHTVTDLFLVRNDKITGIYSYSSKLGFSHLNGSLINALKFGRYIWTNGFKDGYAKVKNEAGHYGLIDLKGDVIIPCIWEDIIYDGGATFATGFNYSKSSDNKNVTYDLRKDGKRVPLYRVDTYKVGRLETPIVFSEGWAIVRNKEQKYGYLKEDWSESEYEQIEYLFDDASRFVDGYSYATYKGIGIILNKELEVVLCDTDKYHIVSNAKEGLVQVCDKSTGKFGFMNLSGKIVIQCVYNKVEDFSNGLSLFYNTPVVSNINLHPTYPYLEGPLGMMNRYGDNILDCNYYVSPNTKFDNGHIMLFKNHEDKYLSTLVGSDGKPLPGFMWDYYQILQPLYDGYALFATNYTFGYYDESGKVAIDLTGKFTLASCFINGFASVGIRNEKQEAKYGCINKDGVNFIPCIYDNEFKFSENGIALVLKDGKIGLIDIYGNSTFLLKQ